MIFVPVRDFLMTQQTVLDKIQTHERLLKQQAHALSPDAYEKLVVQHLHLIALQKAMYNRQKQNQAKK